MTEKFEQISPEYKENEEEKAYREIREEFVKLVLNSETPDPDEKFIKRMKDAAKKLGARAEMIDEEVAKQNMTPEQRGKVEKRKSELYQASADKIKEDVRRWQEEK